MPHYYEVTWRVYIRAKDEADAVERAEKAWEPGNCNVVQVPLTVAMKEAPELFEGPWPSVTFIMRDSQSWRGSGPLLDALDDFQTAGHRLADVIAIIPTQE